MHECIMAVTDLCKTTSNKFQLMHVVLSLTDNRPQFTGSTCVRVNCGCHLTTKISFLFAEIQFSARAKASWVVQESSCSSNRAQAGIALAEAAPKSGIGKDTWVDGVSSCKRNKNGQLLEKGNIVVSICKKAGNQKIGGLHYKKVSLHGTGHFIPFQVCTVRIRKGTSNAGKKKVMLIGLCCIPRITCWLCQFLVSSGNGHLRLQDFMQSGNGALAVVDLHREYILRLLSHDQATQQPFFWLLANLELTAKEASAVELTVPFFSSTFCV